MADKEADNAYHREWAAKNREKVREYRRKVIAAKPDYYLEKVRRRQALKKSVTVEKVDYAAIAERDGWVCHLCGDPVDPNVRGRTSRSVSFDHVIPITRGGFHAEHNIRLAHYGCNSRKGNRLEVPA